MFPAPREDWVVSFELIQIVPFKANGFPAPPKAWGVSYATEVGD